MKHQWKNAALCVVVLIVLTVIGAAFSRYPVSAQGTGQGSAPVTIVAPLPVPVSGTVNVGNLDTATLPVSVTNFPVTQQVSGTVTVANTSATAVLVTVVNAAGSSPFSAIIDAETPQVDVPATFNNQSVQALVVTQVRLLHWNWKLQPRSPGPCRRERG